MKYMLILLLLLNSCVIKKNKVSNKSSKSETIQVVETLENIESKII